MKKCKYCMSEIDEEAKICPNCRKKQHSKKKFIIFSVIIAIFVIYICSSIDLANKDAKNSSFNLELTTFRMNYLTSCVTLEDIANDIQSYWYDSIWEDKYNGDINEAINKALEDNKENVEKAKSEKEKLSKSYNNIRSLECYSEYCDEIKDAVKEAYSTYNDFYKIATSPSGNYNNYNENFSNLDSETIKHYDNIVDLQDLFNKNNS